MASTRRLAAIMFTDMVGSTALAQTDEAGALKLRDEQESLLRPLFATHQGREIKSMGDGFLAEFDSALRAVQCAIDIQQHLHERNSQPGVAPLQLRIGVHLGDVEQRETDIFGDAVNIASRIEPIASPGGVCVSGEVFSQIRNKIPNKLERLPPTGLKGVQVSIDIYRVVLPWTNRDFHSETSGPTGIAVLPFTNISPDPKDEYFADGLTEELITVLSQLRGLRVISRTSVMLYKATPKSASQIGTELGVVSILEGSVRKAGSRLRVTVQLIDARSDQHLWAKTYDRELDDVFAVQAEIAKQVVEALEIELRPAEEARLESRPAVRPDSYLAYLKGRTLFHSFSKASLEAAKEQFELAISLDPRNAAAHSGLADATRFTSRWHPEIPRAHLEGSCRRLAARAIELDPNLAEAHATLAFTLWNDHDYGAAEREFRLALALNPSYSPAHHWYAEVLEDQGRTDEALVQWGLAEGADPLSPFNLEHFTNLLIWLGRLDEAEVKIQKIEKLQPGSQNYLLARANYLLARSDLKGCVDELKRYEKGESEPRLKPVIRALYLALAGETEQAREILRHEETLPEFPTARLWMVNAYCELGDIDQCFASLDKAVNNRFTAVHPLRLNPRCKSIRNDPRFQTFLKKVNL